MAVCPSESACEPVASAAAALARLAGARLVVASADGALPAGAVDRVVLGLAQQESADLVVIGGRPRCGARSHARLARRLLDAGRYVLAVPSLSNPGLQLTRIGVGHDGSRSADAALRAAERVTDLARGTVARVDLAYVDEPFHACDDVDGQTVDSRRSALIAWWLEELGAHLPARVCPLRLVGDPVTELYEISQDLDLLVLGTRRRGRLSRLLTGSVSSSLIAASRCPVLVAPYCADRRA